MASTVEEKVYDTFPKPRTSTIAMNGLWSLQMYLRAGTGGIVQQRHRSLDHRRLVPNLTHQPSCLRARLRLHRVMAKGTVVHAKQANRFHMHILSLTRGRMAARETLSLLLSLRRYRILRSVLADS